MLLTNTLVDVTRKTKQDKLRNPETSVWTTSNAHGNFIWLLHATEITVAQLKCVFIQHPFVHIALPVYLCIRNRDVVCGILNQKADDCLLQVWPVVFPVIFYSHCIQN